MYQIKIDASDYVLETETKSVLEKFFEDILLLLSEIAPGQSKIRGKLMLFKPFINIILFTLSKWLLYTISNYLLPGLFRFDIETIPPHERSLQLGIKGKIKLFVK